MKTDKNKIKEADFIMVWFCEKCEIYDIYFNVKKHYCKICGHKMSSNRQTKEKICSIRIMKAEDLPKEVRDETGIQHGFVEVRTTKEEDTKEKIVEEVLKEIGKNDRNYRDRRSEEQIIDLTYEKTRQETANEIFEEIENTKIGSSRLIKRCKGECLHRQCKEWKELKKKFKEDKNGKI